MGVAGYSQKTEDLDVNIVILPGFQEGLSRRGSWFAVSDDIVALLKKCRTSRPLNFRFLVHEPDSAAPLSDGEIAHLVNTISGTLDRYRSELGRMELSYHRYRQQGRMNAVIYLLGIVAVRWYWWIFLTRGEMSFYNQHNARKDRIMAGTINFLHRIWERGEDPAVKKILNGTVALYQGASGAPLSKYRKIIEWAEKGRAESAAEEGRGYRLVGTGYRRIVKQLTGHSLAVQIVPTSFGQRLKAFFMHSFKLPPPEMVFGVRNLAIKIEPLPWTDRAERTPPAARSTAGNTMELYLLAAKNGSPVCVPTSQYTAVSDFFARSEIIRAKDLPLDILLQVGTTAEKALLERSGTGEGAFPSEEGVKARLALHARLQNASLDTRRQNESLLAYYYKEQFQVGIRTYQIRFPFRSRLHSLFPWLFVTNGIPVASLLAAVWLFVDPQAQGVLFKSYRSYFERILESLDWAYHTMRVQVVVNPGLGCINHKILSDPAGKGYRDIIRNINECALPVSIMDRALLNNLTMETNQLRDYQREANNFTSIPVGFFYRGELQGVGDVMKEVYSVP